MWITRAAEAVRGRARVAAPVPPPLFADTLTALGGLGERFRLALDTHSSTPTSASPPTLTANRLLAARLQGDEDLLDSVVGARAAAAGIAEPKLAAVLFLQRYSYRLACPVLAAWVLHRRVPDMSAGNVVVSLKGGVPAEVSLIEPRVATRCDDPATDAEARTVGDLTGEVVRVLLAEHLLLLLDRLRDRYGLGATIAQGAVASPVGAALTYIGATAPVRWEQVARDGLELFTCTRDRLGGEGRTGDLAVIENGGQIGVVWRRHTCCLAYLCPDSGVCASCPRRSYEERSEAWAARIAPLSLPASGPAHRLHPSGLSM